MHSTLIGLCSLHVAIGGIVKTLFYAHQKELVHIDIKDTNLFKTEDKKTILVNDWGSAVSISAHQSKFSGTVVGGSDNLLNSLLHCDWPPPKYSDDLHTLANSTRRFTYR